MWMTYDNLAEAQQALENWSVVAQRLGYGKVKIIAAFESQDRWHTVRGES